MPTLSIESLNIIDCNVVTIRYHDPAIMTLTAGDLMAYIDCGGPPEDLIELVKVRLQEKKLRAVLELMDEEFSLSSSPSSSASSSCSSDDELGVCRSKWLRTIFFS
ncbi:hypothetical protein HAX54_047012 [Datura stramonium]|uniref:Uncharacterized protein n=1 Tax=Datura stramonium TaxID=4076 RepID=A0ABS8WMI6_DATST|nr:hypothetical protein [Datura stramonium]